MTNAGPLDAVVFDIGGVLIDWNPLYLYRSLIPDDAEREWFLANVCTMAWNSELDAGRSFDEACDELAGRFPDHAELVHAWRRQEEMVVGEIPGTADVVRWLRAEGVRLYILTNAPGDVFRARQQQFEVLGLFDGAVVSGDERLLKPSPDIFALVADRFDLDPRRTFFVDDVEENVAAARASGFVGHRFTDAATLEAALAEAGISPRAVGRAER